MKKKRSGLIGLVICLAAVFTFTPALAQTVDITADSLRNKIRGAIIGQFFGNLNGLEHEFKYNEDPGNVKNYTPDLSDGARTDDDTDIEFPYLYNMEQSGEMLLPYSQVRDIWIESINSAIWSSNEYARKMMDLGIEPPYTGRIALNPWAIFNISGQFLCESFGIISPGMPQTAGTIGTHYTHVAIDGEPSQTTQLFDAMLAAAFFESDLITLVKMGLDSIDPKSEQYDIVSNVITWHGENPNDWSATRLLIKNEYFNGEFGGAGGGNGYRVTTAATIAALLYGEGEFVESLMMAFNYGWDADNTAAMVGTFLGIILGEDWLRDQGWKIQDVYANTNRPGLPMDMTITSFADMHYNVAVKNILANGGEEIDMDGQPGYRIATQEPANVEPLPSPLHRANELRNELWPLIQQDLIGSDVDKARVVYTAVALCLVPEIAAGHPDEWSEALAGGALFETIEALFSNGAWSSAAQAYFGDVVLNGNTKPVCPFDYGEFLDVKPAR